MLKILIGASITTETHSWGVKFQNKLYVHSTSFFAEILAWEFIRFHFTWGKILLLCLWQSRHDPDRQNWDRDPDLHRKLRSRSRSHFEKRSAIRSRSWLQDRRFFGRSFTFTKALRIALKLIQFVPYYRQKESFIITIFRYLVIKGFIKIFQAFMDY